MTVTEPQPALLLNVQVHTLVSHGRELVKMSRRLRKHLADTKDTRVTVRAHHSAALERSQNIA